MTAISIDRLRNFVDVDFSTGAIIWRRRLPSDFDADGKATQDALCARFNGIYAGKPALAHKGSDGYLKGRVDRVEVKAHRVVWACFHGKWPKFQIDHINRIKTDNRIENLRDVRPSENCRNRSATSVRPYIWQNPKPFFGHRTYRGITYSIPACSTEEEAISAWVEIERCHLPMSEWVYCKDK